MTCRDFVDFLLAYQAGELSQKEQAVFDQHMVDCPPCEEFLKTYMTTLELERDAFCDCKDVKAEPVPDALVNAILAARKANPACSGKPKDAPDA